MIILFYSDRAKLKEKNDEKLLKECTFKPNIAASAGKKQDKTKEKNNSKRLYEEGLAKLKEKREKAEKVDPEFEKNKKELLFTPQVIKDK